jgi:hypothetical protein
MAEQVMVRNAADPEQVSKAKEKELRGRDLEISDFAWVLSDRRGRRFLWRLFDFCGINKLSFAGELVATTNFNEGMKNVSNKLMADIMETRPDAYVEMINENKKTENKNGG